MAVPKSTLENQILHFSKLEKWDKVEALWPQIVEDPSEDPKFYAAVARRLLQSEKGDELKAWTALLLEGLQTTGDRRTLIRACRGLLHARPEFEELRQPLLDALRERHAKLNDLEAFLEESGLTVEADLQSALRNFMQFVACARGEVFRHGDWGVGEIVATDLQQRSVVVRFPNHGEKTFSFDGVREFLKKIPKNHFHAQRVLHPEKLRRRAQEKPVEFLKHVLKGLGGRLSRADLKDELLDGVFNQRQWNSWWNRNRDLFRLDPYVAFSGSVSNAVLALRDTPKSFHEEAVEELLRTESFNKRQSLVADIIKMRDAEPLSPEHAARLFDFLLASRRESRAGGPERVEYAFLIRHLAEELGSDAPPEAADIDPLNGFENVKNPVAFVNAMSVLEYQMQLTAQLRERRPDAWDHIAEDLFLSASVRLGQWLLRDMVEHGETSLAEHAAEQLLHRPDENPDLFLWLVRSVREGKWKELHVDVSSEALLTSCLELIDDLDRRIGREDPQSTALKGLKSRVQNLLLENHMAIVSDVLEAQDLERAQTLYKLFMESKSLDDSFKMSVDQVARAVHHDVGGATAEEDDVLLVTAESLERARKEFHQIKNVDIPANSKAIGEAAAQGDLSENAEYDAAKERQKVLFRRLEALEDQLGRARAMDPDTISTDVVGCGTVFEVQNMSNGAVETYTLLGLWDADPENNVLSYQTPFGRQFMNRAKGDIIEVQRPGGASTRYRVMDIRKAL